MLVNAIKFRHGVLFKLLVVFVLQAFITTSLSTYFPNLSAYAQNQLYLPPPDKLLATSQQLQLPCLRGIKFYPNDPFKLNFMVDSGSDKSISDSDLKELSKRLINYFLTSLTIPEKDLWVNLSPYERDIVIPDELVITEMGRDLLGEDYILKQLVSSLTYPETPLGKRFWDKVYQKAYQLYGTTDIPINTFNKIWIVPQQAVVYEKDQWGLVGPAKLKVMMEEDYLALSRNIVRPDIEKFKMKKEELRQISSFSSNIMKNVVLPIIEEEVNYGENFAYLRQIYYSLILAVWFKQRLRQSILEKLYVDKKKMAGIDTEDPKIRNTLYDRYLEAFKKGVYNYVRTDFDQELKREVDRRYFSGGVDFADMANILTTENYSSGAVQIMGVPYESEANLVEAKEAKREQSAGYKIMRFIRNTFAPQQVEEEPEIEEVTQEQIKAGAEEVINRALRPLRKAISVGEKEIPESMEKQFSEAAGDPDKLAELERQQRILDLQQVLFYALRDWLETMQMHLASGAIDPDYVFKAFDDNRGGKSWGKRVYPGEFTPEALTALIQDQFGFSSEEIEKRIAQIKEEAAPPATEEVVSYRVGDGYYFGAQARTSAANGAIRMLFGQEAITKDLIDTVGEENIGVRGAAAKAVIILEEDGSIIFTNDDVEPGVNVFPVEVKAELVGDNVRFKIADLETEAKGQYEVDAIEAGVLVEAPEMLPEEEALDVVGIINIKQAIRNARDLLDAGKIAESREAFEALDVSSLQDRLDEKIVRILLGRYEDLKGKLDEAEALAQVFISAADWNDGWQAAIKNKFPDLEDKDIEPPDEKIEELTKLIDESPEEVIFLIPNTEAALAKIIGEEGKTLEGRYKEAVAVATKNGLATKREAQQLVAMLVRLNTTLDDAIVYVKDQVQQARQLRAAVGAEVVSAPARPPMRVVTETEEEAARRKKEAITSFQRHASEQLRRQIHNTESQEEEQELLAKYSEPLISADMVGRQTSFIPVTVDEKEIKKIDETVKLPGGYTFNLKDYLAGGASGAVYLGKDSSGREVAIKVVDFVAPAEAAVLLREGSILRDLAGTEGVVGYRDMGYVELPDGNKQYFLVMDRAGDPENGGEELASILDKIGKLDDAQARDFSRGLLRAIRNMHSKGIIHADIKPRNIIVPIKGYSKGKPIYDFANPILIDFGICLRADSTEPERFMGARGSLNYFPVEAYEKVYSNRTDLFAAGITLYKAITGDVPAYEDVDIPLPDEIAQMSEVTLEQQRRKAFKTNRFNQYYYRTTRKDIDVSKKKEDVPLALVNLIKSLTRLNYYKRAESAQAALSKFNEELAKGIVVTADVTEEFYEPPEVILEEAPSWIEEDLVNENVDLLDIAQRDSDFAEASKKAGSTVALLVELDENGKIIDVASARAQEDLPPQMTESPDRRLAVIAFNKDGVAFGVYTQGLDNLSEKAKTNLRSTLTEYNFNKEALIGGLVTIDSLEAILPFAEQATVVPSEQPKITLDVTPQVEILGDYGLKGLEVLD